jgi:hypothetical protein
MKTRNQAFAESQGADSIEIQLSAFPDIDYATLELMYGAYVG